MPDPTTFPAPSPAPSTFATGRHTGRRTALLASVALVAILGAACSGSPAANGGSTTTSSSAGAAGTSGTPSSSTPSTQAPTPGGSAHAIDVCTTLPAASAASLSGQSITSAEANSNLQPKEYGCNYSNDDDSLQVEVTVFEHDAVSSYNTFLSQSPGASTVSGLGDKAFFDNNGTMYVLAGNNLIQVNGLDTADESAALARPVLAAL